MLKNELDEQINIFTASFELSFDNVDFTKKDLDEAIKNIQNRNKSKMKYIKNKFTLDDEYSKFQLLKYHKNINELINKYKGLLYE